MADTRPTPLSPWRAVWLCLLLLLAPSRFIKEQEADSIARNNYKDSYEPPHSAYIVRAAFMKSLLLVVAFGAAGYVAGQIMGCMSRCAPSSTIAWLQIVGASVLLWGTLFIRGWEVQTLSGASFTERVNQWLYRMLYCAGTWVVVYSMSFPPCK